MRKKRIKNWLTETEKLRDLPIGGHLIFPVGTRLRRNDYNLYEYIVEVKRTGLYITKQRKK